MQDARRCEPPGSGCVEFTRVGHSLLAVSQNQPIKVDIKGFKTSDFLEQKTAQVAATDAGVISPLRRSVSERKAYFAAHMESTVNQLINWRMCKKHQMGWSRVGAQELLYVKTAIINGRLHRYTGHHSAPADIAA